MLNAAATLKILKNLPLESVLFVSYIAGREPKPQALETANRAVHDEGISPRHFTGTFKGVWITLKGEVAFTLWVEERDSIARDGSKSPGAYRTFNPSLGQLMTLEVLSVAPVEEQNNSK